MGADVAATPGGRVNMSVRPTRKTTPEEDAAIEEMYRRKSRFESPQGYITLVAPIPYGSTDDQGPWGPNPLRIIPAGTSMKIVMVSRFDDCGLSDDLAAEWGYDVRLGWDDAAMSHIRLTP